MKYQKNTVTSPRKDLIIRLETCSKYNTGWTNAEGYYKDIPFKEAFKNAWGNFDAKSRKAFTDLENFDKDVFEFITSVRVDE